MTLQFMPLPEDIALQMPRDQAMSIVRRIAERDGVRVSGMLGPCRRREYAWPRQEAMYLIREQMGWSYTHIARFFGGRDHTTILHGIRRHRARMAERQDMAVAA